MYNKVIMIGNITRDNELKYLPNGTALLSNSIATSHKYKSQSGEQKEEVCFLEFSLFGKSAEIFNQYVHKGHRVMLEGRLAFEQWMAQDGTKRSKHALKVDNFKFLESKSNSEQPQQQAPQPQQQQYYQNGYAQQQPQQPQYQQQAPQPQQQQNIPEVDINQDEIPF